MNIHAEMLHQAIRNYEKFYMLEEGEGTKELLEATSLPVAGWAQAEIIDWDKIDADKKELEEDMIAQCVHMLQGQRQSIPAVCNGLKKGKFLQIPDEEPGGKKYKFDTACVTLASRRLGV